MTQHHQQPNSPPAQLTITVEDAAALLGISRGLAYQAARRGELPVVHVGKRILVVRARLLEMLGERSGATTGEAA